MGHYRAEMVCNSCGKSPCTCNYPPAKPNKNWIVDDDLMPIRVCDFDKKYAFFKTKYGPVPMSPFLKRMGRAEFKTSEEAYEHGTKLIREKLAKLKSEVKRVSELLKNR